MVAASSLQAQIAALVDSAISAGLQASGSQATAASLALRAVGSVASAFGFDGALLAFAVYYYQALVHKHFND